MQLNWPNAALYFSANAAYWKWTESGDAVEWADGTTITFVPELSAILTRLGINRLPPLGSVLLLLAACRSSWQEAPSRRGLLAGILGADTGTHAIDLLTDVCDGLDKVQSLPRSLLDLPSTKAELAEMVFADAPSCLPAQASDEVLQALLDGGAPQLADSQECTNPAYWVLRDLGALQTGLKRVDIDALRLRQATGLESLPEPAPLETPLSGEAWLRWLETQAEFANLARLARRMLAILNLPRKLHDPDELPVGGVSDIAPRGPLDRLLLSELAHDELTLAVRVAMNEALYYRRESPPKSPPQSRHVLVDAGLRSWGLPRVYATAVALALAVRPEKNMTVVAHRAEGEKLKPVTLTTAEGLREQLAALDHRLHPGEALPALENVLKSGEGGEAVIVTALDTLADHDFHRRLENCRSGTIYLAGVARDGRFQLRHYSPGGQKLIASAQLPLAEILRDPAQRATLRDPSRQTLPAIFYRTPFPLLLSTNVNVENSWNVHGLGVITLSNDGRLLLWKKSGLGAQQLATGLRPGRMHGVVSSVTEGQWHCVITGTLSYRGLEATWIKVDGSVIKRVPLQPTQPYIQGVVFDRQYAYVEGSVAIQAVNLITGQPVSGVLREKIEKIQGPYVMRRERAPDGRLRLAWSRLCCSNDQVVLTDVVSMRSMDTIDFIFDVVGVEGPMLLWSDGKLFRSTDATELGTRTGVEKVSRDGLRLRCLRGGRHVTVDTLTAQDLGYGNASLESDIFSIAHERVHRSRFTGIARMASGEIALITRKGQACVVQHRDLKINLDAAPAGPRYEFRDIEHDDVAGFTLNRAEFPDGSEAFLDSRGLLHLRSSDKVLPELTIVLREGRNAAWSADGRVCGDPYYIGEGGPTSSQAIAREVLGPILERLT